MKTAFDVQKEYVTDFNELQDPLLQYEYLVQLAAELPRMDERRRARASLVEGCQSNVWLALEEKPQGCLFIECDSDTLIVRGILHLIRDVYSNRPYSEIAATPFFVLDESGLGELLSSKRNSGIRAIVRTVTDYCNSRRETRS